MAQEVRVAVNSRFFPKLAEKAGAFDPTSGLNLVCVDMGDPQPRLPQQQAAEIIEIDIEIEDL